MEQRALAIDPDLSDAHAWRGTALLSLGPGRRGAERDSRGDPPRSGQRSGASGAGPRALGRQGGLRRRDSGVRALDRAQSRSRLLVSAARAAAVVGRALRGSRARPAAGGRPAGSVHLRQRRAADGRRQRAPRLRLLPAGPQRRGDPRVRARHGVSPHQRPRAEGTQRHGARHQARRRLSARRQDGRGAPALRSRAQDLRVAGRQGRRRSRSRATTSPICTRCVATPTGPSIRSSGSSRSSRR